MSVMSERRQEIREQATESDIYLAQYLQSLGMNWLVRFWDGSLYAVKNINGWRKGYYKLMGNSGQDFLFIPQTYVHNFEFVQDYPVRLYHIIHCGKKESMIKTIKIKYFTKDVKSKRLLKVTVGDWIDLRARETMELKQGCFYLIPLNVAMELPEGYEAHIVPRSSTFKKWGLIQTNSIGIVDNSYCGNNDEWKMPVYTAKDTIIHAGDRVCQFRIVPIQPEIQFEEVDHLDNPDRGGFGSTDKEKGNEIKAGEYVQNYSPTPSGHIDRSLPRSYA